MKLRISLLLIVMSSLVALPALAVDRNYDAGQVLIITNPSALGGCTIFQAKTPATPVGAVDPESGCEQGIAPWVGSNSVLVVDPDPGGNLGTDLPVLKQSNTNSNLTQEFSCASTSNLFSSAPDPVDGCRVYIAADTYNDAVPLPVQASSITPDDSVFRGGYAVTWPNLNNDPYGGGPEPGQGIFCDAWCDPVANGGSCSAAEDELIEGGGPDGSYCNRFLGYTENAWQVAGKGDLSGDGLQIFINPLPVPAWHFNADFTKFAVKASSAVGDYQIFSNALLGNAVRGNLTDTLGYTAGAFQVPLAPLAALGALGTSLAFMGYSALRRRE